MGCGLAANVEVGLGVDRVAERWRDPGGRASGSLPLSSGRWSRRDDPLGQHLQIGIEPDGDAALEDQRACLRVRGRRRRRSRSPWADLRSAGRSLAARRRESLSSPCWSKISAMLRSAARSISSSRIDEIDAPAASPAACPRWICPAPISPTRTIDRSSGAKRRQACKPGLYIEADRGAKGAPCVDQSYSFSQPRRRRSPLADHSRAPPRPASSAARSISPPSIPKSRLRESSRTSRMKRWRNKLFLAARRGGGGAGNPGLGPGDAGIAAAARLWRSGARRRRRRRPAPRRLHRHPPGRLRGDAAGPTRCPDSNSAPLSTRRRSRSWRPCSTICRRRSKFRRRRGARSTSSVRWARKAGGMAPTRSAAPTAASCRSLDAAARRADRVALDAHRAAPRPAVPGCRAAVLRPSGRLDRRAGLAAAADGRGGWRADAGAGRRCRPVHAQDVLDRGADRARQCRSRWLVPAGRAGPRDFRRAGLAARRRDVRGAARRGLARRAC